jgi:hypothetical protein
MPGDEYLVPGFQRSGEGSSMAGMRLLCTDECSIRGAAGKVCDHAQCPVRQIWVSALLTSFKLDWDDAASAFVLPRTAEQLTALIDRLIGEQLQG